MVPIAADHAAHVVDGHLLPTLVADMLPTGNFFEHQEADLIASIEEMARLRVMGSSHDVAMQILAQDVGVFALGARRHSLADEWKRLVPVKSAELDDLSVQGEAVVGKDRFA